MKYKSKVRISSVVSEQNRFLAEICCGSLFLDMPRHLLSQGEVQA